jgi:hypothetical protein
MSSDIDSEEDYAYSDQEEDDDMNDEDDDEPMEYESENPNAAPILRGKC